MLDEIPPEPASAIELEFIVKDYVLYTGSDSTTRTDGTSNISQGIKLREGNSNDKDLNLVFSSDYTDIKNVHIDANSSKYQYPINHYLPILESLAALEGSVITVRASQDVNGNNKFNFTGTVVV